MLLLGRCVEGGGKCGAFYTLITYQNGKKVKCPALPNGRHDDDSIC